MASPTMVKKKRSMRRRSSVADAAGKGARALHYKVVELSNVDEHALERTLNEWVPRGWTFDGVQFAMRESSKRPSMGFVFFTREGAPVELAAEPEPIGHRTLDDALDQLERLTREVPPQDPWERLRAFAAEDDGEL